MVPLPYKHSITSAGKKRERKKEKMLQGSDIVALPSRLYPAYRVTFVSLRFKFV
jgi:hypothetical protein